MKYEIETLIPEVEILKKVKILAEEISSQYINEEVLFIGLLRGSSIFLADLVRKIDPRVNVSLDFMVVSSYGNEMESTRNVKIIKDLEEEIQGRNVIVVEDIIDTGRTLKKVRSILELRSPKSLKICTLLDKPERREVEINADFIGFNIPDVFVVGYGIDYAQKHRSLPYLGKVVIKEK